MKTISFFIFLSVFFIFQPDALHRYGLIYKGDDWSYFAHATSLAFGQFPSYSKEYWMIGDGAPAHPSGPGLMAAPFVFLFSFIDRIIGSDIILQRTAANSRWSWSLFGFIVATSFYLWAGCALLFQGLRQHIHKKNAAWAIILMVLVQGAPLFAFHRPVFSHIYELAIGSFFIYLLLDTIGRRRPLQGWEIAAAGLACGLGMLVRFNFIFMALSWPILLTFTSLSTKSSKQKIWSILTMYLIAGAIILLFTACSEKGLSSVMTDVVKDKLMISNSLPLICQRIWHILVGIDWGLLYTAPFLLIGLAYSFFIQTEAAKALRWITPLLLINLWVVIQWMTQGSWYGYRYIIFSAFPLLVYPFALFIDRFAKQWGWKFWIGVMIIAVFPTASMICFENSPNLNLHVTPQYFGVSGWGNNTYQLEVWKALFTFPDLFHCASLRGGPAYLLYLTGWQLPPSLTLLSQFIEKAYPPNIDRPTLIKTLILYAFPFILYSSIKAIDRIKNRGRQ